MTSALKIELFAYKWFRRVLWSVEVFSNEYDVTEEDLYKDECLAYPECNELSDCKDLYFPIMFRRWLFEKFHLEEIQTHVNEFRHSQTDFHYYILRTCSRVDLFGHLTIFERIFATSAFVCSLCVYCRENGNSEIMRYGYMCWAMYFDNYADEFYKQGGWNHLKMVAASYKWVVEFVDIVQVKENADVTLIGMREAIKYYLHFKKVGEIVHDECISKSWIKFYAQHMNKSFDNEFNEFFEEIHSNELKNLTDVENVLKQLKYLCDPNGSEIVKFWDRMSTIYSLETSMANLNIYDKNVNCESKQTSLAPQKEQSTILKASKSSKELNAVKENDFVCIDPDEDVSTSLNMFSKLNNLVKMGSVLKDNYTKPEYFELKSREQNMKTATAEHLFKNKAISKWEEKDVQKNASLTSQFSSEKNKVSYNFLWDSKKENLDWNIIKDVNNRIINEHMSSTEDNLENEINELQNAINKEHEEWKMKGDKSTTILSGLMTSNNTEKRRNNSAPNVQSKRESSTQATIPNEEKNIEMIGNIGIRNDLNKELDERKIRKRKNGTLTPNKRLKRNNKNHDIRKEQAELKDKVILTGQISSTGKITKEEINSTNSKLKEKEDGDIKNFLRMLLVLGDKEGIDYVKKTSTFVNKEFY